MLHDSDQCITNVDKIVTSWQVSGQGAIFPATSNKLLCYGTHVFGSNFMTSIEERNLINMGMMLIAAVYWRGLRPVVCEAIINRNTRRVTWTQICKLLAPSLLTSRAIAVIFVPVVLYFRY
jgi:hypothetical protein